MTLDHVTIRTTELETTKDFFLKVFDLEEKPRPKAIQRIPGHWLYHKKEPLVHIIGSRGSGQGFAADAIDHVGIKLEGYANFKKKLEGLSIPYSLMDLPELDERRIFFRTLEDATATDLDWFYRGWFFTTDNVDMELADVKWFRVFEENTNIEDQKKKSQFKIEGETSSNKAKDFSSGPDIINMAATPDVAYGQFLSRIDEAEVRKQVSGKNIYEVTIKNKGGLVMPVTIEWIYTDGSKEINKLPAQIWRRNEYEVKQTFIKTKEVAKVNLDPNFEFADVDATNNSFPKVETQSEFDAFKNKNVGN